MIRPRAMRRDGGRERWRGARPAAHHSVEGWWWENGALPPSDGGDLLLDISGPPKEAHINPEEVVEMVAWQEKEPSVPSTAVGLE